MSFDLLTPFARRAVATLAVALAAGGCAQTAYQSDRYVPLEQAVEASIADADVAIVKLQDEMGWSYNRIEANQPIDTGAGPIASLASGLVVGFLRGRENAKRANAAFDFSEPMRRRFDDAVFHRTLRQKTPEALARVDWLDRLEVFYTEPFDYTDPQFTPDGVVAHDDADERIRGVLDQMDGDVRAIFAPTYWMNEAMTAIVFSASFTAYPAPRPGESGLPDPIYQTLETEVYELSGATVDSTANVRAWMADGAAQLRAAAREGAERLLRRLADVVADPRRPDTQR